MITLNAKKMIGLQMMNQIKKTTNKFFWNCRFVIVCCISSLTEPFYIVKIEKKGIGKSLLRDCYGHTVFDGIMFFTEKYLQKSRSKETNKNQFKILVKRCVYNARQNIWSLCGNCQWSKNEWSWIPSTEWTFKDEDIQIGQSIQQWTKQNLWKTSFKKFEWVWYVLSRP